MENFWDAVLEKIKTKISPASYATWFVETTAEVSEDIITVYSKNFFASDWLENHYKTLIFEVTREMFGTTFEIYFENTNRIYFNDRDSSSVMLPDSVKKEDLEDLFTSLNKIVVAQREKINELEQRVELLEKIRGGSYDM